MVDKEKLEFLLCQMSLEELYELQILLGNEIISHIKK